MPHGLVMPQQQAFIQLHIQQDNQINAHVRPELKKKEKKSANEDLCTFFHPRKQ